MDVTQHMDIGQVVGKGFTLAKEQWKSLFVISLLFIIIPTAVMYFIMMLIVAGMAFTQGFDLSAFAQLEGTMSIMSNILSIVLIFVTSIGTILMFDHLKQALKTPARRWQDSFSAVKKRYWPVIGTEFLSVLIFAIPLGVLGYFMESVPVLGIPYAVGVVLAIIFAIYWSFYSESAVLNQKAGWSAFMDSMAIVKKRWWRTLGISLGLGIVFILPTAIILGMLVFLMIIPIIGWLIYFAIVFAAVMFIIICLTAIRLVWFVNWDANRLEK